MSPQRKEPINLDNVSIGPGPRHFSKAQQEEADSLEYMRERESDYLYADDPADPDALPTENLYSSAGRGEFAREGDSADSIRNNSESPQLEVLTDEKLRARVEEALGEEVGEDLGIEVSAAGGVVALFGAIDSPEVRALAEEVARNLPDVREVENLIRIAPPGGRSASRVMSER